MKLFALLGLALAAFAQQLQAPQTTAPVETCVLEGTVLRATDGAPLQRARVTLQRLQGGVQAANASTSAEGKFSFSGVVPGRYRLTVARNGFVRQEYGQRSTNRPGVPLELAPGQKLTDLLFRLSPAGVVTGHVYDELGDPAVGVMVNALRHGYQNGQRTLRPAGTAVTNDLGEYRLFGLAPGQYYLSAMARGRFPVTSGEAVNLQSFEDDEAYPAIYYPGTPDPTRASPVTVGPGDEVSRIDFALVPQSTVRVRGRVVNLPGGAQTRGVQVMLMPRDPASRGMYRSISNQSSYDATTGTFEVRSVPPGSYFVIAYFMLDNRPHQARDAIEVGSTDVDGVTLAVQPPSEVEGKVRVEGGETLRLDRLRATFMPKDDISMGANSARVTAEGSFVANNISPGTYLAYVSGIPSTHYLKSARLGGADVIDSGFTVAGARATGLQLVVSAGGATVEGQVLDKDSLPITGAQVVLVPAPQRRMLAQWYKTATTDMNGRFTMRGIAPGEYKLFAWDDVEQGAWQDPEFLAPYEDRGKRISVAEASQQAVELKLLLPR